MSASPSRPEPAGHLAARLARALCEAAATRRLVVVRFAAPDAPLPTLWRVAPGEPAFLWRRADRSGAAGVGEVVHLPALLATTAAAVDATRAELALSLLAVDLDGAPPLAAAPLLFGGAPFTPASVEGAWRALGPGGFVLPRFVYRRTAAGSAFEVALDARRESEARAAKSIAREASQLAAAALDSAARAASPLPAVVEHDEHPSRAGFIALVDAARAAIARGEFRKVVLARRSELRFASDVPAADVIARLAETTAGVRVFGLRRGGAALVGATPETLFVKRGQDVRTEALAGTAPVRVGEDGAREAAARLVGSVKDIDEQAFVVRAISRTLEPLATALEVAEHPVARVVGGVVHLSSPISATVRDDVSWARLLAALHPTPAVGGTPRDEALAFLSAHEPTPRGWYAGPVGVVDLAGDAEIGVAIRSALLAADRAWVYAGAGIVAASQPEAEYDETASKQRVLLDALGVAP